MLKLIRGNRNFAIIALIAVVNSLGYGIIIPILYSYSRKFGLSDFENGLLFALFSICQFIATPIIGRLSDKYGRRPLLIVSLIGTAVSFFTTAFAPSAIFLFLARALDGITAGNIPVATAVISDTTEEKDRAGAFGIIGASFGFGFIFGPAISAATVGISASLPFIIAGLVTVVAVLVTYFFLPETNKHIGQVHEGKIFDIKKLVGAISYPNIGPTLLITLFYFSAFSMFIYAFQPFTVKILKLSASEISTLFIIFGIVQLLSQLFLVQRFTNMFGLKRAFTISLTFVAFAFAAMFFTKSLIPFILVSMLLGVAGSIVQPLINSILSSETDAQSQGSIFGLNTSYLSIGQIIGPIVGGAVATISIPLAFLAGGLTTIVCIALTTQIMKSGVKKEDAF